MVIRWHEALWLFSFLLFSVSLCWVAYELRQLRSRIGGIRIKVDTEVHVMRDQQLRGLFGLHQGKQ